jgi:hypothetical protein
MQYGQIPADLRFISNQPVFDFSIHYCIKTYFHREHNNKA